MTEITSQRTHYAPHERDSSVRSYSRCFPVQFRRAKDSFMYGANGDRYIDLLCGCGSLNYGHNNQILKAALLKYVMEDGISMSLDLATNARSEFLTALEEAVLRPLDLNYVVQFPGPTGTNAVEAAIKLARKVTSRTNIIAFTNGFHGCSLGALGLTASGYHRGTLGMLGGPVTRIPYDGYLGSVVDSATLLEKMLRDPSGGVDAPAAIVVEAIQGEGGLNVASAKWMQNLARIAEEAGALLIVDDIQAGCGRSGQFFSFQGLGVKPHIVTLAKSISGYGLPMSLVLIDPALDRWAPGEHNGTFRGNNLAFVTATAALRQYWMDDGFAKSVRQKSDLLSRRLSELASSYGLETRGRGMMQGLAFDDPRDCEAVRNTCFQRGLIMETCGPSDEVLKFLPALTISDEVLGNALSIVAHALGTCMDAGTPVSRKKKAVG